MRRNGIAWLDQNKGYHVALRQKRWHAVFTSATALTNVEVANILGKLMQAKKQDDPSYQANPMLVKTHNYASRFSTTKSEASDNQMRA